MWCFLLFFPHSEQPHVHYSERLLIQMFSGFWCSQAEFMYDHHQWQSTHQNGCWAVSLGPSVLQGRELTADRVCPQKWVSTYQRVLPPASTWSAAEFQAYSWLLFLNVLSLDNFLYFIPSWCPTGQVSSESYLHGFLKHKSPLGFREDNTQLSNPLDEHALA